MPELSMYFTKASLQEDGTMRWAATVSDTQPDNHGERVDKSFFNNAIAHAEELDLSPYVCVSHYDFAGKDIADDKWVVGPSNVLYVDGIKFKAKGTFDGTPLAKAAFEAIQNDIKQNVPHDERVRISMGFYDRTKEEEKSEATEAGGTRTVYKDGIIKHFALTRVPVLPRTEVEVWEEKSMDKKTKREDALSIVGEEFADELEDIALTVGKSEAEDIVIKSDELTEKAKKKKKNPKKVDKDFDYAKEEPGKETMAEEMWTETPEEAGVPGLDQAAKRASEKEKKRIKKKKKSETEGEPVEKMIKDEGDEVVLYSKDESKVLGKFPYGEGKKYKDKDTAMTAAKKREGQIQFFKHKKSEAEECDVVGGEEFEEEEVVEEAELDEKAGKGWAPPPKGWTKASLAKYWSSMGGSVSTCMKRAEGHVDDPAKFCASLKDKVTGTTKWRGPHKKSEAEDCTSEFEEWLYSEEKSEVEKAGRKVSDARLKTFQDLQRRMSELGTMVQQLNQDMETWHDDASYTPEGIVNTSTKMQPLPENPAISILEGSPMTKPIEASSFSEKMQSALESVFQSITDKNAELGQEAINDIAKAMIEELEQPQESVSQSESEDVKDEEVEQSMLEAFNIKMQAVLGSDELDRTAKLQAGQELFNELGSWYQKSVVDETQPSVRDVRDVVESAVRQGIEPTLQENATMKAELEELKQEFAKLKGEASIQVPVQKSISSVRGDTEPVQKSEFTAKEVARMTTPQGTWY